MAEKFPTQEVSERTVSFLDQCLYINVGPFEVKDGDRKIRVNSPGEEDRMTFGVNNGKLAFVTGGGLFYVTVDSPVRRDELVSLGYKKTGLGVPLSNNEVPASGEDLAKWRRIVEEGEREGGTM